MYTHFEGHKIELTIWSDGLEDGDKTHVSVEVYSVESIYDKVLTFPARFTITLELLNQHRDQDHYTKDIQCEVPRETDDTEDEKNGNENMDEDTSSESEGEGVIGHEYTFISHADLEWNEDKQTQYLKNDCLRIRVTKITLRLHEEQEQNDNEPQEEETKESAV